LLNKPGGDRRDERRCLYRGNCFGGVVFVKD
jgi:hypothetical protein